MVPDMFICNVKMNKYGLKKIGIAVIVLILICVFIIVISRFYNATSKVTVKDEYISTMLDINTHNYTNILEDSHKNPDKYVGKKIKFKGFIYRLYDFNENQFVLAREMIISPDNRAVVVGFLSICDNISQLQNGCWVEVEGIIEKGYYHGDIPVIKVQNIKEVSVPNDEYVYPPDDDFIVTENI